MDFLNIFRALYLYKKIRRENDTIAIKISYVTPRRAYKVKENDIKMTKNFNSPNLIPPKWGI